MRSNVAALPMLLRQPADLRDCAHRPFIEMTVARLIPSLLLTGCFAAHEPTPPPSASTAAVGASISAAHTHVTHAKQSAAKAKQSIDAAILDADNIQHDGQTVLDYLNQTRP